VWNLELGPLTLVGVVLLPAFGRTITIELRLRYHVTRRILRATDYIAQNDGWALLRTG
jgi:hypothetical protein